VTDIATLGIKIKTDNVKTATKELGRLDKRAEKVEKSVLKVNRSFGGLKTILGAAGLGFAMKTIIDSTIKQEKAIAQLDAAIKSTAGSAGFTSKELQKMAASFQNVTNFGDESIISMQSVLLTFTKLQGDILPRTTEAVLNLSERMGQDLQSSAVMLGKALNDPIANLSALSRSGIQFSTAQKDMIKRMVETGNIAMAQGVILDELETQFGGAATAARDTFAGALKSLGNAFGDLLEGQGGMEDAQDAIEELIKTIQDPAVVSAFSSLTSSVIGMTTSLANGITYMVKFGESLGYMAAKMAGAFDGVSELKTELKGLENNLQSLKDTQAGLFGSFIVSDEEIEKAEGKIKRLREKIAGLMKADISNITSTPSAQAAAPYNVVSEPEISAREDPWYLRRLELNGLFAEADRARTETEKEEAEKRASNEIAVNQMILSSAETLHGALSALIAATGKDSKGIQLAMLAFEKSLAITRTIINTEAAAIASLVPDPTGITAARIKVMGGIATGIIGATGVIQAGTISGQAHDGMDNVPSTGSYILEKGEMVLDKGTSEQVRNNTVNNGGFTVNFSFLDGDGAQEFWDRNGDKVYNTVTGRMYENGQSFA